MKPLKNLQALLDQEYRDAHGNRQKIVLHKGMQGDALTAFKDGLPQQYLPPAIAALLQFATGLNFPGFGEIRFTAFEAFGLEEAFPHAVQLADDGAGNAWIVDIDQQGVWKEVYYVCHDPTVVVKHSLSLADFILQLDEYGKQGKQSNMGIIQEERVHEIYEASLREELAKLPTYNFPEAFQEQLPAQYIVEDLREQTIQIGFNWARFGPHNMIIRFEDQAIWVIER